MSKKIGASVLFLAVGAILGLLAGYGIEHSSLIYFFSGTPLTIPGPGEHIHHYQNPLDSLFTLTLGAIGAIGGAIVGLIIEATRKNNDKTPSA